MRRINILAKFLATIAVCITLWSTIGGSPPVVQAQVAPITQKIDTELLYLIDQYAGQQQYYNSAWKISVDQYKAWIATIAWAEGSGRYAAHSQYGSSSENIIGDRFDHVAAGDAFRFSTGIGPFQLDPIVSTWPTIYKLNAKKALLFVLAWHRNNKGAGSTLNDFSTNSPWLAVWPDYIAVRWQQVTNTGWDDHKDGITALDWNGEIRPRLQRVDDFDDSVRYIGSAHWNARVTTDTLKTVVFEGHFNTWLISPRGWETDVLYTYYYTYSKGVWVYDESTGLVTYDPDTGCEVWVWDNAGQPNEYRYVFAREFTEGRFPELRTLEGGHWIGERYVAKAGQTLPSPALNPNDLENEQVSKGLTWLRQHQNTDGSWTYTGRISESNVGLTSMAAACFLNYGLTENNDYDLCRALNWICEHQNEDGSITTGVYPMYDTSLAIMALVAAQNSDYYENIREAADYLLVNQNRAETGYPESNKYYGGWSYGPWLPDWADLSNSQFVLFALHYAENVRANDTLVPAEVWDRAEVFVQRCQNREASNPDWSFYDDGGFIYQPGSTIWAGGQSYASMTAAGLWGLFTCGVSESDGRVQDAWGWIQNNYYMNQNYPIGSLFVYYYAYSLAKACILWGVDELDGHDWYQEISQALVNYQQADGHWSGTDPSEEPDNVATCWALLALESKLIPPGTALHIEVHSPADLHVYDPLGRHVGINYETGEAEIEIPGATYSGPGTEPQIIEIPDPIAGTYRIELVGRERGDYTLTVEGRVGATTVYSRSFDGSIDTGEQKGLDIIVSAVAGPITIDIPDTIPPGAVTDLATGNPALNFVTLNWTAPGDDWNTGTASEYDIRYSTQPITEANWDEAIRCEGEPTPQPAGSSEVFTVTGLAPGATYYFALKTADEIPNWSELSNVVQGSTFVTATVDFDPDVLNLRSSDKYVTAYIELPPGFDVRQIDIPSIRLNNTVPALPRPTQVGDHDSDGIQDLMVKFSGAAVKNPLSPGNQVQITITGQVAGIGFRGIDTIRVIDPTRPSLTVSSTTGGSVTMPGEGTFSYKARTVVSLVAVPASCYHFVNWTGDVGTIANVTAVSTTITMHGDYDIVANFECTPMVSAGWLHTVGLKSDGTIIAVGHNWAGQCDVDDWVDISQVAAGSLHTVGLRSDGTVVAVGDNSYGQCDVGDWTGTVQVSAGKDHTVGLRSDGTVVAVGDNSYGQCDVDLWTDIVQVSVSWDHTVGLRSNGAVVAVGDNSCGQCEIDDWTDIVQVAAGWGHTVGLRSDGTVVAVGDNYDGECNVGGWTGITQVAAGGLHTVGVRDNGTVVAVGWNFYGQCDVANWIGIIQASAGGDHTLGLKDNGTVVATGYNDLGQCNVSGWDLN